MGKQAVFINVDETSISLARPDLKGNIVPGKYSLQQKGMRTRGALTHVASILQPIRHPAVSSASDFEQHTCCESEADQIVVAPAAGNSAIGTGQDWLEYSCFLRRVFENAETHYHCGQTSNPSS